MAYSIFKSIKVVNPEIDVSDIFDVIIEDNKINAIVKNFDEVILSDKNPITFYNCNGLTMAPGLVDMRVNIGKTENLKLTQKVASENGITSMVLLPNQTPKLNNPSIIDHIQRQSEDPSLPKVWVYGAATKDDQSLQMCELGLMAELGAVGFTNGNKSIKNSLLNNTENVFKHDDDQFNQKLTLGKNTPDCVEYGCLAQLNGIVNEGIKQINALSDNYLVIISGGDREKIFQQEKNNTVYKANIVLLGLIQLAKNHQIS